MKRNAILGVVAMLLAIAGVLYWLAPDSSDNAAVNGATVSLPLAGGTTGAQVPARFDTGMESLPHSLQGTEVDGELEVDAGGHLKITSGVRHVFDYFLSAVGEEPLETILARLRAYIRHKLPAGAAAEAEKILDGYIAYKRGLESIHQSQPNTDGSIDINAVRQQMEQVQALRSQYLSAEVIAAFFGDEDAYDRYTLARLGVMQNKNLSAAARARQLSALEQQLPASLQESMKTLNQYQNLESLTADWKKRGGSPAELRQIRESLVGVDAADRLETLDKDRAAWDQRMNAWFSERAAILGNNSLSSDDRERQLDELRKSRFNETERLRVETLERMHDKGESAGS